MTRLPAFLPLALTCLLVACGGHGASPDPSPTTAVSCTLPLQYADGGQSGIAIAPQARSVDRLPSNCRMPLLQSATLTVCVDHPNRSELSGQLLLAGKSLLTFDLSQGILRGHSCLATATANTALLEFTANNLASAGLQADSGPWSVVINDTVPNNQTGHFVAWSLELKGLQ